MTKNFSRVLGTVILFGVTQTSWADQAQVYYTYDPSLALQNIKTRSVPIDMDVQQFLATLNLPYAYNVSLCNFFLYSFC